MAHDFNNLLTVIYGHASLQLSRHDLDKEIASSLEQISIASERATALTRQLLAFSRKQVVQQRHLDLNTIVDRLRTMLPRMLGETIHLDCALETPLPLVHADESSVEQILMNLAVNARDAMADGGLLRISTGVTGLTDRAAERNPEARPGRFVVLTVADTGCGMDRQTLDRIFEPFFTTKPVGKGTGLGMSTVYGIVKQHEGWIEVESEVGRGTLFRIYLPAHAITASEPRPVPAPVSRLAADGSETILVVEDELAVRRFVQKVLAQHGYRVFEAGDGHEATRVWEQVKSTVTLLLTDMVMPDGMSGTMLAQQLIREKNDLKVIYTSGYSTELVSQRPTLEQGWNFLGKPFSREQLLGTVRRVLDSDPKAMVPANPAA